MYKGEGTKSGYCIYWEGGIRHKLWILSGGGEVESRSTKSEY